MKRGIEDEFSVIIPTLQRAPELDPLVRACAAHPAVLEVLVINNAVAPLAWASPKVRVLQQAENIFVNPAWNLGVAEAKGRFLAIVNDDVEFDVDVFDHLGRSLRLPWVGIIGVDGRGVNQADGGRMRLRLATYDDVRRGFGMFMALRHAEYSDIPDGPLIWGGDDWLFQASPRLNWVFRGAGFKTEMSTTSGSPEFSALRRKEIEATRSILQLHGRRRWWNKVTAAKTKLDRLKGARLR